LQEEDRRRKPNLAVLRGHKLSANDSRTASTLPVGLTQACHAVSPTAEPATAMPHAATMPRSTLPPISHKRDISSANINRPLHVSSVHPYCKGGRFSSRVVSVLDSGAVGPGFKSQPRRCRVTVLGKLFTSIVPLFMRQRSW